MDIGKANPASNFQSPILHRYRRNHILPRQRKNAMHINNKRKKIPPPPNHIVRRAKRRRRKNILPSLRFVCRPPTTDRREFSLTVYTYRQRISQTGANSQPTIHQSPPNKKGEKISPLHPSDTLALAYPPGQVLPNQPRARTMRINAESTAGIGIFEKRLTDRKCPRYCCVGLARLPKSDPVRRREQYWRTSDYR